MPTCPTPFPLPDLERWANDVQNIIMDYGFRQNGMKKMKYIDKIKLNPNNQLLQLIQPMGQADKSMGHTDARMHKKPLQDKLSRHPHILSLEKQPNLWEPT